MNLPFIPDLKTAAVVALVVGALAFVGGYKVADWRLTGQYTAEKLEASQAAAKALAAMTDERDILAGKLSAANDRHTDELRKAQNETNSLRDRLRAGSIGLRIAATCPDARLGPQASSGARVDTGTGAELGETARRAYFALRDGIDRASAQLAACQDELRLRTEGGNKSP
ncbi:MAG: lysis system i-spanin subunit Rz [Candidatus Paceibacterota bacterium]|jgi:hypothetical protein